VNDRPQVRLDPHLQRAIVDLGVADDDRPELLAIALPEHAGSQRDRPRQVRDVFTVDRMVAGQLRQREIVRVERQERQLLECSWQQLGESFAVRLGQARDTHVLEEQSMLSGQRRCPSGDSLESFDRIARHDLDVVDVTGRPGEVMPDGQDEPAETV
jgi:hypothetical protein